MFFLLVRPGPRCTSANGPGHYVAGTPGLTSRELETNGVHGFDTGTNVVVSPGFLSEGAGLVSSNGISGVVSADAQMVSDRLGLAHQFSFWPQARREVGFGQERGSPDPPKADLGVVLGAGRRPALLALIRVTAAKVRIGARAAKGVYSGQASPENSGIGLGTWWNRQTRGT